MASLEDSGPVQDQGQVPSIKPGALPTLAREQLLENLSAQSHERLKKGQVGFAGLFLVQIFFHWLNPPRQASILLTCETFGFLYSVLGILALSRAPRRWRTLLSEIYLIGLSAIISLGEAVHGWTPGEQGLSRLVIVVLLIPVFLPSGLMRSASVCVSAILTAPVSYLFLPLLGLPMPEPQSVIVPVGGDILSVFAALLPALTMAQLNQKNLETYELGQYQLLRCINQGGMGELWLGRHRHLRLQAAIKFIRPFAGSTFTEAELCERFQREAHVLSRLTSPNTVRILDFGQDATGRLYLVMELLQGIDLEKMVQEYGAQSEARTVELLIQACRSLEEAHHLGLIHRDVKPANFFLTYVPTLGDFLKVLDFGMVGSQDGQSSSWTSSQVLRGTPGYMSPEQLKGEELGPTSDIYCLGCIAFWLLTGQEVFAGDKPLEALEMHLNHTPPRPSWRTSNPVSEELDQLVEACLAKKPQDRPQSCKILRERLLSIQAKLPPSSATGYQWWTGAGKPLADKLQTQRLERANT